MDYIHYYLHNTYCHLNLAKNRYPQPIRILISWIIELKKLQENKLIAQYLITSNQWNKSLWSRNWFIETRFQFGDYVLCFPRVVSKHVPKFWKQWLGPYKIQYCLPNNTILLITIDKFDLNLVLLTSTSWSHMGSLKIKLCNLYWSN
jgi:hypothetical protein